MMMSKYDVSNSQGQFADGERQEVLLNKLGIVRVEDINDVELVLLEKLYHSVLGADFPQGRITLAMLRQWHHRWLGNVYDWAGHDRSVNISKDGFMFAPAAQIVKLMGQFQSNCLDRYTPCADLDEAALIEAIAITHIELILIHPFREGNGRLARLLSDVMAVQAGFEPLDYGCWENNRPQYIAAIHHGMLMDYQPMQEWVKQALTAG
ncbi:Probable adenosine monophosphate-protein transferase fic [Serratia quinivorans]|jgi:cell filamentation protein|nr:Probable adenosine monophosphate-protein transferase fic [Serratia quinivorans]CAI1590148.1 Probable adenosine monophosphate-protein transferase fic [Serratia quinivorans]CAI1712514.1 Probable adenosine monophosphate-protein transferase fic [Serratia quinivorans]